MLNLENFCPFCVGTNCDEKYCKSFVQWTCNDGWVWKFVSGHIVLFSYSYCFLWTALVFQYP